MPKIAVVAARGLGDGLLSLILSHNLTLAGHDVVTFNTPLTELRPWFPHVALLPHPEPSLFQSTFSSFDRIIAADYSPLKANHHFGNELLIASHSTFDKKKTQVQNLVAFCKEKLLLPHATSSNGITPPPTLCKGRYPKRIVLHPMSATPDRSWPKEKFFKLSKKLETLGFEIAIAVSPKERPDWETHNPPLFTNLSDTASYIYESGFLIGNDSGLGHLASNLGIPVLSLFAKETHSRLWRPGWHEGVVVTPFPFLIGGRLKQKYWKEMLGIGRVLKGFKRLAL